MKEMKPLHVGLALILFLLALAILEWATLPKRAPALTVASLTENEKNQPLPSLAQNELNKPVAIPTVSREFSLSEKETGDLQSHDEIKDPEMDKRPEL